MRTFEELAIDPEWALESQFVFGVGDVRFYYCSFRELRDIEPPSMRISLMPDRREHLFCWDGDLPISPMLVETAMLLPMPTNYIEVFGFKSPRSLFSMKEVVL